jgi:hypothetical protein
VLACEKDKQNVTARLCRGIPKLDREKHVHDNEYVKTERITVLATPDFKRFLESEAEREGISVGELVRIRCGAQTDEERILEDLTAKLRVSVSEAKASLKAGLQEADKVLKELQSNRTK